MDLDLVLRMAYFKRRDFFKLWNQIQQSEDVFLEPAQKLKLIVEKILEADPNIPPAPKLPLGIRFVSMLSDEYPELFLELPQPPLGIFVEGHLNNGQNLRAAVVGSRKPIPYSRRLTREVVKIWSSFGYSIISGGAVGIDGEAHHACLEAGGHTVAVLGGGILRLHPRSHFQLFKRIISSGGALVSEYPPHFEPRPYTFPERNRLIAALSDLLFLAQAHEKSGSLSTARSALDLGREIYVLRPVVGDENFAGSQSLVDAGARVLISASDLEGKPESQIHIPSSG